MKSGSLNLLEPSGPVQACNGIAFCSYCLFIYLFIYLHIFPALHKLFFVSFHFFQFSFLLFLFVYPWNLFLCHSSHSLLLSIPTVLSLFISFLLIHLSHSLLLPTLSSFFPPFLYSLLDKWRRYIRLALMGKGAKPTQGSFFCGLTVQIITKPIWKQCASPVENKGHATKETCYTVCTAILGLRNAVFQVETKQG